MMIISLFTLCFLNNEVTTGLNLLGFVFALSIGLKGTVDYDFVL